LKPYSTFILFFADVSKNIIFPFSLQYLAASSVATRLYPYSSKSNLFPKTKKGKEFGLSG
jgi:hypothetical protein